jgi:hypothetical protein
LLCCVRYQQHGHFEPKILNQPSPPYYPVRYGAREVGFSVD